MGFGSDDESKQETQSSNTGGGRRSRGFGPRNDYDGTVSVESDDSTDEPLDQFGTIKDRTDAE
ncbi:hypothetical protein C479_06137 [Halovivax asiaticus JCM 14624]|uniref:DUF5786 domain-containing protein n=1 Tax=Halovivax asiaticus JCM 14624 TaxID=1227490 RepID=M0BNH4_9EURY|nr:DUF5786 family protein [Halovivax asiaticus]ELZ12002.1 hypothetical protein C479_06137 [Halovivax asiaticus JCM 14624]